MQRQAQRQAMTIDDAEALAITCLAAIARDSDLLERFLSQTGLGPADLRAMAGTHAFLLGVLEFVMADESSLLAIAASAGIRPTRFAIARHLLDPASGAA